MSRWSDEQDVLLRNLVKKNLVNYTNLEPNYLCVDLVSGQRGPFPRLKLTKACWTCPPPLDA